MWRLGGAQVGIGNSYDAKSSRAWRAFTRQNVGRFLSGGLNLVGPKLDLKSFASGSTAEGQPAKVTASVNSKRVPRTVFREGIVKKSGVPIGVNASGLVYSCCMCL